MSYIKKEPIIEFITKGLNNPDKSKAYGYDAIEILAEIEYAPTADITEVVRCEKCLHGRSIDKNKVPEKYFKPDCVVCECEEVVGDEPMIYLPTHYCSFGKAKGG